MYDQGLTPTLATVQSTTAKEQHMHPQLTAALAHARIDDMMRTAERERRANALRALRRTSRRAPRTALRRVAEAATATS
jgi:hypothetical protein